MFLASGWSRRRRTFSWKFWKNKPSSSRSNSSKCPKTRENPSPSRSRSPWGPTSPKWTTESDTATFNLEALTPTLATTLMLEVCSLILSRRWVVSKATQSLWFVTGCNYGPKLIEWAAHCTNTSARSLTLDASRRVSVVCFPRKLLSGRTGNLRLVLFFVVNDMEVKSY